MRDIGGDFQNIADEAFAALLKKRKQPGYTAYGNDCYWLRRQASITGSPYWWSCYNQCVGYDYY